MHNAKTVVRQGIEGQSASITDEGIRQAEAMIGVWLRRDVHWPSIAEPISPHDIRRWALYSVGDDNPLWTDTSYGQRSVWGRNIAPPTFLYSIDSTIVAPGLPGIQWIHGGTRWEHYLPVGPGDTIRSKARVIGVTVKKGRRTPRMVLQTGEILYLNQNETLVARAESDILRVPRLRSGAGMQHDDDVQADSDIAYSDEEIAEIHAHYLAEQPRGGAPRYWEDVELDETVPPRAKGPLTLVDIMAFYAGRRSVYNPLRLAFKERDRHPRNVYVSPKTNVPVHPAAGHFDVEIAHEVGMPGAYDQGWMRTNWLGHLLTDWCSDFGFVRNLNVRLLSPNLVGDLTWCRGFVTNKRVEDGTHLVDVEVYCENQRGIRSAEGSAIVELPARALSY